MAYAVSRDEIIEQINGALDGGWTAHEMYQGKDVTVARGWRLMITGIIEEYRMQGWIAVRMMQLSSEPGRGRRDYILFQNPLWQSNPGRARGTALPASK